MRLQAFNVSPICLHLPDEAAPFTSSVAEVVLVDGIGGDETVASWVDWATIPSLWTTVGKRKQVHNIIKGIK